MLHNEIVHHPAGYVAVQRNPDGEVERRLSRPATAWWCEHGPVNSCCCCFGLRTGIYLLAVNYLIAGIIDLHMGSWMVTYFTAVNGIIEQHFNEICTAGGQLTAIQESTCDDLRQSIATMELLLDYVVSMTPFYLALGLIALCFSALGFSAAWTGKAVLAKIFMMVYPLLFFMMVVDMTFSYRAGLLHADPFVLYYLGFTVFFLLYYFKVAWSFYTRCRIEEEVSSAGEQEYHGEVVQIGVVSSVV